MLCSLCFKTKDDDDKNFFKVPKDKRTRRKWGEICRIDFKRQPAWICKDHFIPSQMLKTGNKTILLPTAVPFIPLVKEPEKIIEAAYRATNLKNGVSEFRTENLPDDDNEYLPEEDDDCMIIETPYKATNSKTRASKFRTEKLQAHIPDANNEYLPEKDDDCMIIETPYKATNSKTRASKLRTEKLQVHIPDANNEYFPQKNDGRKITKSAYKAPSSKKRVSEFQNEKLPVHTLEVNNENFPQLQDNLVMEIPVKKTVFCTRPTQTNTRYCGLVETSAFVDDFRLNCFYCADTFPLEKWKDFTAHLQKEHFKIEKAFETFEYISEEHDYAPTNLATRSSLEPVIETIGISPESLLPFLGNEEEPTIPINPTFLYTDDIPILDNIIMEAEKPSIATQEYSNDNLDPIAVNPPFSYAQDDEKEVSVDLDIFEKCDDSTNTSLSFGLRNERKSTNFKHKSNRLNQMRNVSKQVPRKTVLSRFLKRTIREETKLEEKEDYCTSVTKIKEPSTPVISFEYSPSAIVDLLLDSMRNYPVLWQFNTEPFNDDFSKSIAELCKIINDKWSLNIDQLTMIRSINRILRFYCYLHPNENIENIHPFTHFYDQCAEFMPSSVNDIAYARCFNCFICYKCDFDLKRHLLKEQSFNLKLPYKCVLCKECFKESDEYEFHKRLPHYTEVFRCEPCKKKFFRRNIYNRHITVYHPKDINERKFKCDQCDRTYKTLSCMKAHQVFHGERKYKCHLCSKTYHENAKLREHLKTHLNKFDFICEVCAKAFVNQSGLNQHMATHTGNKITCPVCKLELRKSSLSRHLRLLHTPGVSNISQTVHHRTKGKIRSYKRLVRTKPFVRRKERERRKYQCNICMIDFETYKTRAEHNKEMHSDLPKWPCQLCSTIFSQKLNLKRHYRKKHNLHVIQVYKLVEEGYDLSDVLSIKTEQLDMLAESGDISEDRTTKSNPKQTSEVKPEFLSDDYSMEENMQSFTIQDEIMKAADNITKEGMKMNYINDDFFTEILK